MGFFFRYIFLRTLIPVIIIPETLLTIFWNSIGVKEYNILGIKNLLEYKDQNKGWDKIDLKV